VVQAGEFAALLKKFDAADIVILGTGRVDPRSGAISYTFTATNLETNLNLGYASIEAWAALGAPSGFGAQSGTRASQSGLNTRAPFGGLSDSALEAIADHALARLGCDLISAFERAASSGAPSGSPSGATDSPATTPR
jgi:hypothetical protein